MAFELREGSMFLFPPKERRDEGPDFTCETLVNGVKMEVALWKKKDKNGNTFLSGNIKPARERTSGAPRSRQVPNCPQPESRDLEDDIPF